MYVHVCMYEKARTSFFFWWHLGSEEDNSRNMSRRQRSAEGLRCICAVLYGLRRLQWRVVWHRWSACVYKDWRYAVLQHRKLSKSAGKTENTLLSDGQTRFVSAAKFILYYIREFLYVVLLFSDRHLHSADTRTCVVPRTNTEFGDRSFSTSGPKIWNSLPSALTGLTTLKLCCVKTTS